MTLVQNRGAFIASPGVTPARDVFVTRGMIEPRMLSATATQTQTQIRTLQQHSKKEEEARAKDDRTPTDE